MTTLCRTTLFLGILLLLCSFGVAVDELAGSWDAEFDPDLPNVLILGDSISIGYTRPVRDLLDGKANVVRPMSAGGRRVVNCGSTVVGLAELEKWLGNQHWDVIHFNWGLHDLCYRHPDSKVQGKRDKVNGTIAVPLADYKKNLEDLVKRLKKTGATLVWCSTTPVPEGCSPPRTNDDTIAYNAVAKKIMEENEIAIDDLYAFALPQLEKIQREANVHFTPEGSAVLAEQVAAAILKALDKK